MAYRPTPRNIKDKELYSLLEERKLTYAAFARKVGISRGYVSKLIQQKRPLSKPFFLKALRKLMEEKCQE